MTKQKKDNKYFDPRETNSTHKKIPDPREIKLTHLKKSRPKIEPWERIFDPRENRFDSWGKKITHEVTNPRNHATCETYEI